MKMRECSQSSLVATTDGTTLGRVFFFGCQVNQATAAAGTLTILDGTDTCISLPFAATDSPPQSVLMVPVGIAFTNFISTVSTKASVKIFYGTRP